MYIRLENVWCIYVFFIAHLKDSLWNQFISEILISEYSTITLTCGRYTTKPFCRAFLFHITDSVGWGGEVSRKAKDNGQLSWESILNRLLFPLFRYREWCRDLLCMCSMASSYVEFGCDQCDSSYVLTGLQLFIRYQHKTLVSHDMQKFSISHSNIV